MQNFGLMSIFAFFCLVAMQTTGSAEQYAKGVILLTDGNSIPSAKIRLSRDDGKMWVRLKPNDTQTYVAYSDIKRIVVSDFIGGKSPTKFAGLLELRDGRSFEITSAWEAMFADHYVTVFDPITKAEGKRDFYVQDIVEVDFSDGSAGQYRVAGDGRIYPGSFVFDPRTGEEMSLVDSPPLEN